MSNKHCTRCDRTLPIDQFHKDKKQSDEHAYYCKDCMAEYGKKYRERADGIYSALKGRTNFYRKKEITISRKDFVKWYDSVDKKCVYCGLREEDLHKVNDPQNDFCDRLTIDCVDNYVGYANGNLVLACKRCNNIKNDFFTLEETKEICKKYVVPRWEKELGFRLA